MAGREGSEEVLGRTCYGLLLRPNTSSGTVQLSLTLSQLLPVGAWSFSLAYIDCILSQHFDTSGLHKAVGVEKHRAERLYASRNAFSQISETLYFVGRDQYPLRLFTSRNDLHNSIVPTVPAKNITDRILFLLIHFDVFPCNYYRKGLPRKLI